ncbi:phage major tropism determinant [Aliarcobacter butzleri]|uniref:phage major tropism determinant n=1 Tax=Aliarcobacter butzleri TaxID=28197 RepID=UPI0021B6B8E7|nr:hypothetical protein [Aliarcobacter butzleri]MCT7643476.1 hypothetical protein [Aliarcobacter butzleri]
MSSKIIPVGFDNITILRGSKYVGVWDWEDCDFEGRTATIKIKNIHPDFKDKKNAWEVGTARVEPLDIDWNPYKGRVEIELTKEETFLLSIPEEEEFLYDEEGGYYSVLNIILDDGTVILSANVKVINSLEVETLDYLVDEKDKAAIINEKLDDILLRNDEYISARDNLIDVVIPKAINTYDEKLEAYNLNHTEKVQILEDIATIVGQDKNVVGQDKLDIETMKQNVQDNKDSVASMKDAIEIMLDTFDDRFLGKKDSDPTTDNDGEPLIVAAIYYNEIDKELKFYNGVSWDSPVAAAQTYAQQASQSADSANASKLEAKQSEDNAKLSEETAIQKALEASQSADSVSEDRIVVEELESSVQNLAQQVANDKQAVSLDKQTVLNAKTNVETIRDSLQASVNNIANKVNISDVQDLLTSTDSTKPLSANQGRILKGFIDNINTVLNSDDTTLDELQEIVNFIKQNKSILDTLGISNIAGLQSALNAKADKTEVYTKTILDLKISTQQFDKPSRGPLFIKVSPSSIKIPAGLKLTVGEESFKVVSDYTLTLASNLLVPETKTAGTDYYVYAKANGTFYISSNENITTDRLIGGFHYGLVGETEALTGNKTEADMVKIRGINAYSFWDLKYRPVANSEGMVCIGKKWYDIYLLNSEHIINGTSKAGATIAGGETTGGRAIPKIPLEYGGNGTLNFGKFTWYQALEIAKAHGKELIPYSEFPTIAYGVLEGASSQTNAYEVVAGKIEHYPNLTSKYGIEQATGVQWIWGADLANGYGTTDFAWKDNADGRGQIYSTSNSPTAVLLGGYRGDGVSAGSRASSWHYFVWVSSWHVGCRFACDHLELE